MIKDERSPTAPSTSSLDIVGMVTPEYDKILTPEALGFVEALVREFGATREELLQRRTERQEAIDEGHLPTFLPETAHVREAQWRIAPEPADLQDRRVEITG